MVDKYEEEIEDNFLIIPFLEESQNNLYNPLNDNNGSFNETQNQDLSKINDEDIFKDNKINLLFDTKTEYINNGEENSFTHNFEQKTEFKTIKNKDNKIREIRIMIINNLLLNYLNNQIFIKYDKNIGYDIFAKKLMKIEPSNITINNAKFNRKLLASSLKDIFQNKIQKKYSNYPQDHNMKLINKLLNEDDDKKRQFFNILFSKTFLECLQCLNGQIIIEGLEGLKKFFEQNLKNSKKDIEQIKFIIKNYEKIYNDKKDRKPKLKKNK